MMKELVMTGKVCKIGVEIRFVMLIIAEEWEWNLLCRGDFLCEGSWHVIYCVYSLLYGYGQLFLELYNTP